MRQTRPWARGKWTPVIVYGRIVIRTCFLWVHHASTSNLNWGVNGYEKRSKTCVFMSHLSRWICHATANSLPTYWTSCYTSFFSRNKTLQLFHLLAVRKLRAVDGKFLLITRAVSDLYNPNEKRARALTSTPVSHERMSWEFVMLLSNVGDENCYLSPIVTIKWFLFLGLLGC